MNHRYIVVSTILAVLVAGLLLTPAPNSAAQQATPTPTTAPGVTLIPCPTDNRAGVYLWPQKNFQGHCTYTTQSVERVWLYSLPNGVGSVSTLPVGGSWKVTFYSQSSFQGLSQTWDGPDSEDVVGSIGFTPWSLKVQQITSVTPLHPIFLPVVQVEATVEMTGEVVITPCHAPPLPGTNMYCAGRLGAVIDVNGKYILVTDSYPAGPVYVQCWPIGQTLVFRGRWVTCPEGPGWLLLTERAAIPAVN